MVGWPLGQTLCPKGSVFGDFVPLSFTPVSVNQAQEDNGSNSFSAQPGGGG